MKETPGKIFQGRGHAVAMTGIPGTQGKAEGEAKGENQDSSASTIPADLEATGPHADYS